jgi:hypothetical protein
MFLDLDMLVGHMFCQVREGLLELDLVLSNVLRGTLLQTVPGVSELLVQFLESIIRLKRLTEKLTRVRGLGTAVSRLVCLIHCCPQGPRATLQVGGCCNGLLYHLSAQGDSSLSMTAIWSPDVI